ncbi:MAG: long-chain fatty acid--CoA ligase [Ignavibacteriales bacterium UTCHB2]|jgi:long-chain acyl-CoA synthetase|nr:MAG: long-chain fatty acid--CoA ligase [Ignavibacteriales bacterium UTCHB2]HQI41925.1 AMP-binding protein [Ignavibacteriaceae bacterium]
MIHKDQKVNYNELIKNINFYSFLLPQNNLTKVAIFSENRFEWVYAFYSAWMKNAVAVPIDFMSSSEDVAFILNDCKPEVVFYSAGTKEVLEKAISQLNYEIEKINLDDIIINEASTFSNLPEPDPNATAVIIYTSGTTGSPKGVMLSYDNLLANIEAVTNDVNIYTSDDRLLVLLPLHHIFPLMGTMIIPLGVGGTIIFSPSMASEDIMATLQQGITIIIGVPRLYNLIRKGIKDKIDKSGIAKFLFKIAQKKNSLTFSRKIFGSVQRKFGGKIKFLVSGGAALDKEVAKDYLTLGFEILEGFGMTECAPMITFTRPGKVLPGSAGQPLKTNEVKIIDGEIVTRGRNVMQGYYNRPEETSAILKDGWLFTGDLGYLNDDNRIFITGRKKEIIVLSNGKNINPEEIEDKILSMNEVITEIGVFEKSDLLHAVIYPDYQKAKQLGIENVEEMIKWEVIDKYNQSVTPYKKVMKFSLIKEPLPRTRLLKLKRFLLPQLEQISGERNENIIEPAFQEYTLIKEFLHQQKEITIHPSDHLEIDLGLDSLDKVNLGVYLESNFGIKYTESELVGFSNVVKLAEDVRDKKTKLSIEAIDWGKIFKEHLNLDLPKSWFTHNAMKNSAKVFLKLYFRLKGEGLENIPEGPFIIAPNHQSFFDGLFVAVFLKNKLMKQTYFYAKEKHVKSKLLKFIANKNNVIVMDLNDLKTSLQKLAEVLKRGKNIIIFPEGTRTLSGEIGDFKKTFAILSRELNVPVVPVAIRGAYDALPRGTHFPKPWKKINVKFLKPVKPENHTYDSLKDIVKEKVSEQLIKK